MYIKYCVYTKDNMQNVSFYVEVLSYSNVHLE